MPVKEM